MYVGMHGPMDSESEPSGRERLRNKNKVTLQADASGQTMRPTLSRCRFEQSKTRISSAFCSGAVLLWCACRVLGSVEGGVNRQRGICVGFTPACQTLLQTGVQREAESLISDSRW